jgi:hypothetical protein
MPVSKLANNNGLHTEPRVARLFEVNDVRRGPVNPAVIRQK